MNMFIDPLPSAYEYEGRIYEMRTDFREWIRFELLLTDKDIPYKDKFGLLQKIIFPVVPPDPKLWDFLLWFYACGKKPARTDSKKASAGTKKQADAYSFEYDDGYIYAAFRELYGIDLVDIEYLHWWKFKAMFRSLHDCKITDIMGYRTEKITSKTPDYRKDFLNEMKKIYALPRSLSEEQKLNELRRIKEKAGY